MNSERDLLRLILKCGWADVEKLEEIISTSEFFDIDLDKVFDSLEFEGISIDFHTIMEEVMSQTFYKIADEIESLYSGEEEVINYLREEAPYRIYLNYLDSWWNIEVLDNSDLFDKNKIFKEIINEVKNLLED